MSTNSRGPRGRGMMQVEKAKDFRGSIAKLLNYLRPYYVRLLFIVLFAVFSTVFSIIGPRILGSATTKLAEGLAQKYAGTGGIDFDAIARILLSLGAIYILAMFFSFLQGWMMAGVT